jgi:hypothetical protein
MCSSECLHCSRAAWQAWMNEPVDYGACDELVIHVKMLSCRGVTAVDLAGMHDSVFCSCGGSRPQHTRMGNIVPRVCVMHIARCLPILGLPRIGYTLHQHDTRVIVWGTSSCICW